MPRISNSEVTLTSALNDLQRDWDIASSDWHDQARKQFEEDYLEEIHSAGRAAVRSMGELTLLLRRIVRECS